MVQQSNRPGILLYFDLVQPLLSQLNDEQVGQLFRAAFEYGQHGTVPSFEPGIVSMAWALIQPAIERDGERYNETILQRKYAVYVREQKRNKMNPISYEDFKRRSDNDRCHSTSTDNDRHRPITGDNGRYPTTTTKSNTNTNTTPNTTSTTATITETSIDACAEINEDGEYEDNLPF